MSRSLVAMHLDTGVLQSLSMDGLLLETWNIMPATESLKNDLEEGLGNAKLGTVISSLVDDPFSVRAQAILRFLPYTYIHSRAFKIMSRSFDDPALGVSAALIIDDSYIAIGFSMTTLSPNPAVQQTAIYVLRRCT